MQFWSRCKICKGNELWNNQKTTRRKLVDSHPPNRPISSASRVPSPSSQHRLLAIAAYKQLCCRKEAARCFVSVSSQLQQYKTSISLLLFVTQATDLSLRAIKCCSVVFGITLRNCHKHFFVVSFYFLSTPISVTTCGTVAGGVVLTTPGQSQR